MVVNAEAKPVGMNLAVNTSLRCIIRVKVTEGRAAYLPDGIRFFWVFEQLAVIAIEFKYRCCVRCKLIYLWQIILSQCSYKSKKYKSYSELKGSTHTIYIRYYKDSMLLPILK